jgi:DNA mismatch endonuclease (patch repair protein)
VADIYSKHKRSRIMSRIKGKGSKPEEAVAAILRSLGVSYRRNVKSLPGKPDFVIRKKGTVIFVHGCFWHRHPNCKRATMPATRPEFWRAKLSANVRRDRRQARWLRKAGWRVITVWQCRLRRPDVVRNRLAGLLGVR